MADIEFEEFYRPVFETHTVQFANYAVGTATSRSLYPRTFYSLTPNNNDFDELVYTHPSDYSGEDSDKQECNKLASKSTATTISTAIAFEDDEEGDGLKANTSSSHLAEVCSSSDTMDSYKSHYQSSPNPLEDDSTASFLIGEDGKMISENNVETKMPIIDGQQRRRRKLPEIPKVKKSVQDMITDINLVKKNNNQNYKEYVGSNNLNLLQNSIGICQQHHQQQQQPQMQRSFLSIKHGYLLDEDSSPDSERMLSLGDVDSGHSTAHSPTELKSISPPQLQSPISQLQPPNLQTFGVPFFQLEVLEATHRGLHKFIPRHHDEIEIEIGDSIYIQKEAEDLWCEGVNLRTGRQGIFPSAYAVDLDYNEFDPTVQQIKKERYLLDYLGSVETLAHKGTGVVCQAVRKIVGEYGNSPVGHLCILEISDQGLRMVDRSATNNNKREKKARIDYFYSLKNVSFCAFHPRDHRFIGFITKHPTVQRFACHVFKGSDSTRPVAEAVGRAFQRFYQKFIETAYPIEDIYIE